MKRNTPKTWICLLAAAIAAGCSSSSSSPSPIPINVPGVGSAEAAETTYTGVLVHNRVGAGPTVGWRLHNPNVPGSVPVDVSKVAAVANKLSGQMVVAKAHSAQEPGGRLVLQLDTLVADSGN